MEQEEYLIKLKRLEEIFQAKPGTPEGEEADKLAKEIREFDEENYPIN